MDEDQILGFVTAYLKKKGFTQTEHAFQEELQQNKNTSSANSLVEPDSAKQILSFSKLESGPARFLDGYSRLRSWAYISLDLYKHELLRVLYPVFIHCFMDLVAKGHIQEARNFSLPSVKTMRRCTCETFRSWKEMEFAHCLRQSKFNIKI